MNEPLNGEVKEHLGGDGKEHLGGEVNELLIGEVKGERETTSSTHSSQRRDARPPPQ